MRYLNLNTPWHKYVRIFTSENLMVWWLIYHWVEKAKVYSAKPAHFMFHRYIVSSTLILCGSCKIA